jgi:predicted ATPase/transcriptional regulator with XRE-family HTH domain
VGEDVEGLLAEQLQRLRRRAGLSQQDLAERAGVSLATIGALEQGRRQPHPHTVTVLADALGLLEADRVALLELVRPTTPPAPGPRTDAAPGSRLVRLPVAPTTLIGRDAELARAHALLDPDLAAARLLSLVGPGGVGKTRLAVAVAASVAGAYANGAVFVELAPLRDPRLVPATIARALEIRESEGRSARRLLVDALREQQVLLVLDNFEHLPETAALVAELLTECSRLCVLVTTRVALRLRPEFRLPISPLDTPGETVSSVAAIAASPAVRLFVERAQAVAPDFSLDATTATTVAAICRRLDGLPLSIELAAARSRLLRPDAMLRRLEPRLSLLTGGALDLPERQRGLRQTLVWSHDLLGPQEQILFRRLAVFVGGWTLAAAEAVCGAAGLLTEDVLDPLQVLVDSSLVRRLDQTEDEPRFEMLETMREYAGEKLVLSGELERLRGAHATYYSRLTEPVPTIRTFAPWVGAQAPALTEDELESLEAEFDNIQAALDWWFTDHHPAEGLRLAIAFHALWSRRGQYALGRRWLEAMLDLAERAADSSSFRMERAVAITEAGTLAGYQGDNEQARALHRRSVEAWRELDYAPGLSSSMANLGLAEWVSGDAAQAVVLLEEALVRSRAANAQHTIAITLRNLGLVARSERQYARAATLFKEAAAQDLPPGWFRAYSLARSVSCSGRVAYLQHDFPESRSLFRHAFEVIRQAGITGHALADCLDWQAALEAAEGERIRAARLFGAADTHWRSTGAHRYAPDEASYARDVDALRASLDGQDFAVGWAAGTVLSAQQAITYALGELD